MPADWDSRVPRNLPDKPWFRAYRPHVGPANSGRRLCFVVRLAFLSVLLWACGVGRAHAGLNVWTSNGPGGGTVLALAIDPATPSSVYAGTNRGGVFKSTNGGTSWTAVNTGLPFNTIAQALAIDPVNTATLYVGTTAGVFKSTNGGASWTVSLTSGDVRALVIDPMTPSILYAGLFSGSVFK